VIAVDCLGLVMLQAVALPSGSQNLDTLGSALPIQDFRSDVALPAIATDGAFDRVGKGGGPYEER
jgi:hypothetical protein